MRDILIMRERIGSLPDRLRRSPRNSKEPPKHPYKALLESEPQVYDVCITGNRIMFMLSKSCPGSPDDITWCPIKRVRQLCPMGLIDFLARLRCSKPDTYLRLSKKYPSLKRAAYRPLK